MTTDNQSDAFASKATENLASAGSEYANDRYNACANRAYYACFQGAIAALLRGGITTSDPSGDWGHRFVQAQFNGVLVNRRHLYPSELRDVLSRLLVLRHTADYEPNPISRTLASRALHQAEVFVEAIARGSRRV